MYKCFGISGFVLFAIWGVCTQANDYLFVQEVRNQFGDDQKAIWLNFYRGTRTDGKSVAVTLAHNGQMFRGILHIPSLAQKWKLEGSYHESKLQLAVIDSFENFIGTLDGEYEGDGLFVKYLSKDKTRGFYYNLIKSERENFLLLHCPANNWYLNFEAVLNRDRLLIYLQKETDNSIYGYAYSMHKQKSMLLKGYCASLLCHQLNLQVYDETHHNKEKWIIDLPKSSEQSSTLYMPNADNKPHSVPMAMSKQAIAQCTNLQQGSWQFYAEYAYLSDQSFDKWVGEKVAMWTGISKEAFVQSRMTRPFETKVHMEIELLTKDWVSGCFYVYNLVHDSIHVESFIYDRRDNRLLEWNEVFIKGFDYSSFFKDWINAEKAKLTKNQPESFCQFILSDSFDRVSLCPIGIVFQSRENPIYGKIRLIMPFHRIKYYVKKSGPFKKEM